jgi:hypothetical protein
MLTKDIYLGIFLILLAIAAYLETLSYPINSAYFPQFILMVLFLLGMATVFKELVRLKRSKDSRVAKALEADAKVAFWKNTIFRKVMMMVVSALLYMVVMSYIGFFVTTSIYLPVMMRLLGIQKLRTIILSSGLVVFFIYLIFVAFLCVPFPEGISM